MNNIQLRDFGSLILNCSHKYIHYVWNNIDSRKVLNKMFLIRLKALEEWLQDEKRFVNLEHAKKVEREMGAKHIDFIYIKRATLSLDKLGSEATIKNAFPFATFSADDTLLDSFDFKPTKLPRLSL